MDSQTRSLDRFESSRSSKLPSSSASSHQHAGRGAVVRRSSGVIATYSSGHASAIRDQSNETSISVHIWHPSSSASSAANSALSKAPILRDVPQVKRKLTSRRDRDSLAASMVFDSPSGSITSSPSLSDPRSFVNLKSAAPSWLREKPSKAKLSTGLTQKVGGWRKATLTFRETGVLLVLGEDKAMLHSISTCDLLMSDVRLVDDSLFGRPYVLGIFSRPSTLTATTRSPPFGPKSTHIFSTGTAPSTGKQKEEPIYICFPNSRKLCSWRSLFRTFSRPEIYGPANGSKPKGTHRRYRQIDMTVHEMRLTLERPPSGNNERLQRSSGIATSYPADNEEVFGNPSSSAPFPPKGNDGANAAAQQQPNGMRRTSLEVSAKAISNVIERLNLGQALTSNSSADSTMAKEFDDIDDSKSMTSTDSIVAPHLSTKHLEGPQSPIAIAAQANVVTSSGVVDMDRRPSDGSLHNASIAPQTVQASTSCCQVWMDGEVIGRTRVCAGTTSIAWYDKFSFQDLPFLGSLHVEVLQAWRPGKFVILGYVDVPVETMRRGENVEGWYPIWALPRLEDTWSRRDERSASYTREVVGELKLALNVFDETILEASKYDNVKETLNGDGCVKLIRRLCKELEEVQVISHLVDVYTASGTIVERLADLTRAESVNFGAEPALLFRGNSLLSRAIDKYQRRYCLDWLEACVGPTVRKICSEKIKLEQTDAVASLGPSLSSGAGGVMGVSASSGYDDASLEMLRTLSQTLWQSIYANRHNCPPDLRRALSVIRKTVNQHYNSMHGPGVQGVGAFVFLRLICPAITSPSLYGLMGTAPEQSSIKTLMLLAKVFLALANKRQGFDKDKEPWLVKMNDFLQQHASAYDDFITMISSEPDDATRNEAWGDERDFAFQRTVRQRIDTLPTLHREAIARPGIRMDPAQAMAALVSYVVRGASLEPYADHNGAGPNAGDTAASSANATDEASMVNDFVDMCCDIEDLVGYHLDRAGYDPEPLSSLSSDALSGVYRTTSVYTANKASPSMASVIGAARAASPTMRTMLGADQFQQHLQSSPSSMQRSESANSIRARRATVSASSGAEAATAGEEGATFKPKMSYIGEDSFLRSQFPSRFANERNGEDDQEVGQAVTRSAGVSETPKTWDEDSGQSLRAASGGAAGQRRQSANLGRQTSNTTNAANEGHSNLQNGALNRITTTTDGTEEERKRRGWWRRKK